MHRSLSAPLVVLQCHKTPPLRLIRVCAVIATLFAGMFWAQELRSESRAKNVLLFYVDDLNDWISLLDPDSPIETPNLERLAARGVSFSHAYCASPACNPSRVATLTGLRPSTSGVYGNKSDWRRALPVRLTLMQQFRKAGYEVRGAGKIFHHHLDGAFHDGPSFEDFQAMPQQNYPAGKLNKAPEYGSKNTDWGKWPATEEQSIDHATAGYCIRAIQEMDRRAVEQRNTRQPTRPWFLACGIFKPHSPFFAPARFHQAYEDIELPVRLEGDWQDLPSGAESLLKNKKWFWR
ncbi:MAG: sulfatase-like hydrolase/transferase, partial [Planctomycetota bacterium]